MKSYLPLVVLCTFSLVNACEISEARDPQIIVDQASTDIFPDGWRGGNVNANARLLLDTQVGRFRAIVDRALAKYPQALLDATLVKLYGLGHLEFSGVATGGTRSFSTIYVVCKPHYTDLAVEGIIHAEYSSILFQKFAKDFDAEAWRRQNAEGSSYLGSGTAAVKAGKTGGQIKPELNELGYISEYAQASMEEDFNCHATRMFMGDKAYWQAVEKYPRLKAKAELTMSFYAKLDGSISLAKFIAMRTQAASALTFAFTPDEFLPPAPSWSGASESLLVSKDHPWITPAEQSGMTDTPNYADTIAWLEKVAVASPLVRVITFGHSAQGRPLCAVIASREGLDAVSKLPANGKPTLLAQAGIHSGEIDGKDAGMMLLRDIAFGGKDALLDRANLLFIPVLNTDGHERRSLWNRPNQRGPVHQGWRTTAQNLNLNRDYMKAQAPEMQAVLRLITAAKPALYLDIHVTDGVDYQYDITFGFHGRDGGFAWSPKIGAWLDGTLRPALDADLEKAGHIPGPLVFAKNGRDLSAGIVMKPSDPCFSHGYSDLRHVPALLIENHSLKPFRQRVLGTYVLMATCLRVIGERAAALKQAIAADEAARPATLSLNWNGADTHERPMRFLGVMYVPYDSAASGTQEVRWLGKLQVHEALPVHQVRTSQLQSRRPNAYYLPVTKADMIAVLATHGVQMERLENAVTLPLEYYRLVEPKTAAKPFEGRHALVTKVKSESGTHTLPAGTVKVSTDQPLGDLAIALLEPEHCDSMAAWGFVSEILQRTEYIEGYAIAPMAEQMMKSDPKLRAEFEAKLAAEPAFARDAKARLEWFYERSPFYDQHYLRYPVAIER